MKHTPLTGELIKNVPLSGSAFYLSFFNQYGGAIVTGLAILYGVVQIVLRIREHKKIMDTDNYQISVTESKFQEFTQGVKEKFTGEKDESEKSE